MRTHRKVSPWRGLLAGAVGGLVASAAMSQFHSLSQKEDLSAQPMKEDSTVKAASAVSRTVFHHELTPQQKKVAGPVMHYGFGTTLAAFYGIAVEFAPFLRTGWGMPYGVAAWLGAHVITVPALGLSEPVTESAPRKEAVEFGAHLVYGAVVEGLRLLMRTRMLAG
jgi:putative membrane protein